jgi:hypothetical protein
MNLSFRIFSLIFGILFLRTLTQPRKGGGKMKRLKIIFIGLSMIFLAGFVTQSDAAQLCFTGSINTPYEKIEFTGTLRVHDVGSGGLLVNGEIFPKDYSAVFDGVIPFDGTLSLAKGKILLSADANVRLRFGSNEHFGHLHAIVEINPINLKGVWRGDVVVVDANNNGNTHEYFTGSSEPATCP